MRRFIPLLLVAAWTMPGAAFSEENGELSQLLLSKLTLDSMPGQRGSFVEIYNSRADTVAAGGLSVVYNGTELFTLPEGTQLPGKSILAVQFADDSGSTQNAVPLDRAKIEDSLRSTRTAIVRAKPIGNSPAFTRQTERHSGYCALLSRTADGAEKIHDYVRWGKGAANDKYLSMLKRAGAPIHGSLVLVGESPSPGEAPVAAPPAALKRCAFNGVIGSAAWVVAPLEQAPLGQPNSLPPPLFLAPASGTQFAADNPTVMLAIIPQFELGLVSPVTEEMHKKGLYRVQIATDPQFTEIVHDKQGNERIVLDNLKPGLYFARAMLNASGTLVSTWSTPLTFTYGIDTPSK